MSLFFKILRNDLKLIFRDPSLFVMFFLPVIILLICRIGIPQLSGYIPLIHNYYWLIVAGLTSITTSTPSFLIGFILLDERDENIHTILSILPLPKNLILKSRIVFMMALGYSYSIFILAFNGLVQFPLIKLIFISILFSMVPPVLTFSIVAFAKNKIEAATIYKGLSIAIFLPVVAFFTQGIWKYVFGIIPFFWTYNAIHTNDVNFLFFLNVITGVLTHSTLTYFLYQKFRKKWLN